MKKHKIISFSIIFIFIFSLIFTIYYLDSLEKNQNKTKGQGKIVLEFYYNPGCGACQEIEPYINKIEQEYGKNITVEWNIVNIDNDNYKKWRSYKFKTYPSVVIKNVSVDKASSYYPRSITLLDTDEYSKNESFDYRIVDLTYGNLVNEINYHLAGNYSEKSISKSDTIISTPLGQVDYSKLSLPLLTIVLGTADSVNPCSFFVLLFLLSILLHTHSRKRMLLVGSIFIFFSGLIYFILMVMIMNATQLIELPIVALIAGLIAIVFGVLNIKDFFFFKKGVSTSIPENQKKRLYSQMRKITQITSTVSIVFATIILAISANTVELLCSLGLPLVYTGTILPLFSLSIFEKYVYLFFYNIVYILPLLVIVLFVSFTLGRWKLSKFQGQILKLFSGLMILSLGITLILKIHLLQNILFTIGILLGSLVVTAIVSYIWKNTVINSSEKQKATI
ncbi:MAG TPA: hypothetical protein ENI36_01820 [Thermoplasmatales archaeon]|nr:hypothetical protein [Thermoplasmatales archaeon]